MSCPRWLGLAPADRLDQHVGEGWGDDAEVREDRGLKHRARRPSGTSRPPRSSSPCFAATSPTTARPMAATSSAELPQGRRVARDLHARLASGPRGSLTDAQQRSPLARVPYHLRHAAVSLWLNAGVPATQVAEWAGHSVHVLLKVYAKCIDGQDEVARRRIEAALKLGDGD